MLAYKKIFSSVFEEVRKVVIGQDDVIEQVLTAVLADGNALLEGYPGLAKTLSIRTLAKIMDLRFSRIQNTPDLMPSDITGTYIIEEHEGGKREFKFHPGPIFANIILADEINRATPKTQSALLEAMQEKQVTVGTTTYKLDLPFFVLATQNPIEQEGSLAIDQHVFIDGSFIDGNKLLEKMKSARHKALEANGKRLYKLRDSYTLSMNFEGKIIKSPCWLYTIPYNGNLVTIRTEGGRKITVTGNHPFVISENGIFVWKKAGELQLHDMLVCPALDKLQKEIKITSCQENSDSDQSTLVISNEISDYPDIVNERIIVLKEEKFSGEVFGLVVPGLHNYVGGTGGCGISHNTYPLPEAQSDRFLLKIKVGYPSFEQEVEIVNMYAYELHEKRLKPVISKEQLLDLQQLARQVPIATDLKQEVVKLVTSTRNQKDVIEYGASPRASIGLVLASKARALINGRSYVSAEDIKAMAYPVLRHRLIMNFEAERKGMTTDDAIKALVDQIKK